MCGICEGCGSIVECFFVCCMVWKSLLFTKDTATGYIQSVGNIFPFLGSSAIIALRDNYVCGICEGCGSIVECFFVCCMVWKSLLFETIRKQ